MIDDLTKIEKLSGNLFVDGEELGECQYELKYNPYTTNEMVVELLNPPRISWPGSFKDFEMVSESQRGRYSVKGELKGFSGSDHSFLVPGKVDELLKEQRFEDRGISTSVSIGYLFPLTSITDEKGFTTTHASHGFVRGTYDKVAGVFKTNEKDPFLVPTEAGEFHLSDEFDHHSRSLALYGQEVLLRRSVAGIKLEIDGGDFESAILKARVGVESLFLAMSLVERDRIGWHTERLHVDDENGNTILTRTTHVWVSPTSESYRANVNAARSRRETLQVVCNKLASLAPSEAEKTHKTIRDFIVANVVPLMEHQHIHWHSCLDFYKKEKNVGKLAFSKALVTMFDCANLPLEDIVTPEEVAAVRQSGNSNPPAFGFTQLRNSFIHDGFDAFDGRADDALEQTRIMRALAERLLLHDLGIDYRETSLGQPGFL